MQRPLDFCKLVCPEPVLATRRFLEKHVRPATFDILVDNPAACENVTRFLKSQGYAVQEQQQEGVWLLAAQCEHTPQPTPASDSEHSQKVLVCVTSTTLGTGDDTLGTRLMTTFLATLPEMGTDLWRLIFINSGVRLTTQDSPALAGLQRLEKQGIPIWACGACLEHYGLTEAKAVGSTTNMLDIVTSMQLADKVIQL